MGRWSSLFLPYADPALPASQIVVDRLREGLTAMGYELYNPFAVGPGKGYKAAVKLFVCNGAWNWIGVVPAPEPITMMATMGLAKTVLAYEPFPLCLLLALDDNDGGETVALIEVYVNGVKADPLETLSPYLKAGRTLDHLRAALSLQSTSETSTGQPSVFDVLPDDVKGMAAQVNQKQVANLVSRLSKNLVGKLGAAPPGTGDLLRGNAPAWDSMAGKRILAVAECLTLPPDWLDPDFAAVRDAYALKLRLQRNPKMMLLPGDQAALDSVPDALEYTPVYGGKL